MTVYKRPGSPFWQIEFEYKGNRVRNSSGTTKKRAAEELERKWRRELHDKIMLGQVVDMTLADAIDKYLDTVVLPKGNSEAATRDIYSLNKIRKALGPDTLLADLSARTISDFKEEMLKARRKPGTVDRYLAIIKAILRKAHKDWGALVVVPAITLISANNKSKRWLSMKEEEALLAVCPPHLRDLVVFLLDTGARLREATRLTWRDVDLNRKPRPGVSFMMTKSEEPRTVPLTERAAAVLQRLHSERPEKEHRVFLYRPVGRGGVTKDKTKLGRPRPYNNPYGAWNTARERAGLKDVRMHDLRHTFASRLVKEGVPLLTVSKLLGHSTINMTTRYAHLAPDAFDGAIGVLEAVET